MPVKFLLRVATNPNLRSAVFIALSGAGFAFGNLLAARAMDRETYGHFALFVAIQVVTSNIAPLGLDQALLRRETRLNFRYASPIAASALTLSIIAAIVATTVYGIGVAAAFALVVATVVYALQRTVSCALRRYGHILAANAFDTSGDWSILIIGAAAVLGLVKTAGSGALIFAAIGLVVLCASVLMLRRVETLDTESGGPLPFAEALPLFGIVAAGAVLVQAERLMIPLLLSVGELATFAILTSVAIAPFRVLSGAIVSTLTQQLRRIQGRDERRHMLAHELRVFGLILAGSTVVVTGCAPFLASVLTRGEYRLGIGLCLAACVNGAVKIVQAIPRAVATGIGSPTDLQAVNRSMWLCVLGTAVGAVLGAPGGLATLVLLAALGSALGTIPAIASARRTLAA